ncbi:MAG TPA: HDIG domain-containing protein [Clostridiaceae bacterium]|nr:HDIG domain-containing protein [Clostridiaceae bacterium]
MFLGRKADRKKSSGIRSFLRSKNFYNLLVGIFTIIISFMVIESGAAPKKYNLKLWDKSQYDITAPRDIENTYKMEQNAREAAESVTPVVKRLDNVPIEVLYAANDFIFEIESARNSVSKNLQDKNITKKDRNYNAALQEEQANAALRLSLALKKFNVSLYDEQIHYLIKTASDEDIRNFKEASNSIIQSVMAGDITKENLALKITEAQNMYQEKELSQELKDIGSLLVKSIFKPNSVIDIELTNARKKEAYEKALENKIIVPKDSRIISYGDIVTEDKLEMLKELNLLETGKFDYIFAAGIVTVLILLSLLLILFMNNFCRKILYSRNGLILLCAIVLLTIIIARVVVVYSSLLIPVFMAAMLISILLDVKLAVAVNFILSVAISLMVKDNLGFIYLAIIGGSFSAFIVSKANQRSRLSAAGLFMAVINVLITISMGIINKSEVRTVAENCLMVSINGIVSTVLTIGMLPFLESTFNIITPLKLLELANPNQPLIKRLLMEAPGTYHHSLMVGNLAEVATEAIEGNALLARVGAYYHDIGKLKRPNFFKENQMGDNPHDRMTANLSTLVITSHTHDGIELAEKYKIPQAIKDIILQHHGNTLVAYFYHKAKKADKCDAVKEEDYRYDGPKPTSKEAAVVMLADSVEAAVRSMTDRTEGKIEGLVRKIIKDKLDDGQLDHCELTLKDLDTIARSFMRVFSGYFHEREQYPEIKHISSEYAKGDIIDPLEKSIYEEFETLEGERVKNVSSN